jgi:NAD(P)-dependent dehydrogenase (short-subunit alcohol dehydrogenase family)
MGRLDGRVAVVTGAGRGLGREHALFLAAQGAAVIVNDLGGAISGEGADSTPAQRTAADITAAGGRAIASGHDISSWAEARALIEFATTELGGLDILVNNAGNLRDRALANMGEEEWDAVIRVHLKGHAAMTRHALAYWRDRAKAGASVKASIIHTTSLSGLVGNFGQANYAAAKLGIVALSQVAALEAARYGVRSNSISPSARTRGTLATPGAEKILRTPEDGAFDTFDPANVSPLVGWLAEADCLAQGQIFHIYGDRLVVLSMPTAVHQLRTEGRWTLEALDRELPARLVRQPGISDFMDIER